MITFSLQSGSNGNCIYVEALGVGLLFDAGISGKSAEGRMRVHHRDIRQVSAVFISHEHVDHVRGAGIFQRKFGTPLYMTQRTHQASATLLGPVKQVHHFQAGQTLQIGPVAVHTLATPHDATDGVAFVVEAEGRRLGILTDLGHPFAGLMNLLPELDACYLESNYDPHMLATGSYAWPLQERIRGPHGHLSNAEAGELIRQGARRLRWAALAHLSAENNYPELALDTNRRLVGQDFPLHVAGRYAVSEVMSV